jgi:hypothetical protein
MPQTLFRLSCGIIYTSAFRDWVVELHRREVSAHPHRVLTLDYVRCASGPARGRAWWQTLWIPEDIAKPHHVFQVGPASVHIPKAAQHGLRERCLDFRGGQVVVCP